LEGRNGDELWTVLDERRDDSQLNGKNRVVTFDVKTRLRVRVIRLRPTGVTHSGDRLLAFTALEFFGALFRNGSDDWRLQCIRSLRDEFTQLKTALIERAVLPEGLFVPGADPLDGIISQLTQTCGGNVADQRLVGIRSASVLNDDCLPRNAADLGLGSIFQSKIQRNQWIEWDFKTAQIEATHYSIITHAGESGDSHLRNWVLEGRNGDESWTVLDERRDDSQLNGKGRIATFDVKTRLRVRVIRLRPTGVTHAGDRILAFTALEFFGALFRPSGLN
jgi:hypothetical protein